MKLQSARLYYRELLLTDDADMFALDSNPEVHRYLHNNPYTHIAQSRDYIATVRAQYIQNGIGRMATFLKETREFIGWTGIKLESNVNGHDRFYDIGYRLLPQHWGKGYATESSTFFIEYAFTVLGITTINATALRANTASCNALLKSGLIEIDTFYYQGQEAVWFEIKKP
ncbi:GNAT family N-acetyltransferase [Flavobacterium sp. RHBU_24]|uniref:GNAT family N-acetyltransferase n=1 Tax=Flavobacterium sp. RHBU_24 TaxID=3391185 RepID=UPI003985248E